MEVKMPKIDIDQDVFEFLQKNAIPFVDTPNTVLKRLLKIGNIGSPKAKETKAIMATTNSTSGIAGIDTNDFVHTVLKKEFPEGYQRKPPYRFMFETVNSIIYFQNFNQPSATLWYRITKKPLQVLRDSSKESFICLTNPAEGIVYQIPLKDIESKLASSNWTRDYLEINIDHVSNKWKELDWHIRQYLKSY